MTVAARIVPTDPGTPPLKDRPAAAALPANESTISVTGLRITNSNSSRPRRPGHAARAGQIAAASATGKNRTAM